MENAIDFESIFRTSTPPCLLLQPRDTSFFIVDANDALFKITGTQRAAILGKKFRDAFPRKATLEYYGSELLLESFRKVLREGVKDKISPLRYDLPDPESSSLRECYWRPKNVPVINEQGAVTYILHSLKDVTAQVLLEKKSLQLQEELVKTRQQYQHFVERNSDGLYSLDPEGRFTSANPGLTALAETDLDALLGKSFLSFCAPEDTKFILDQFERAIKGENVKFEANFISAKGRKMILEISLVPNYQIGEVAGAYGIARDITSIRRSEKIIVEKSKFLHTSATSISTLLQSDLKQKELQEVLATVGEAVGVDRIYYFTATHQEAGETYYSQTLEWTNENSSPQIENPHLQDMPKTQFQQLLPSLEKDKIFTAVYSEVPEGAQKEMFEMVGAKAILLLPIFIKDQLYGILGFDDCLRERQWTEDEINFLRSLVNNFTSRIERLSAEAELQKSEEDLRRSQQKFKALVQEGSDLIGILDQEGKYKFASESTRSILGIPPEEFLGNSPIDFVHPDDIDRTRKEFGALKEEKRIRLRPFRLKDGRGGWRWLETTVTDLRQDPAVDGIVINCRDVTEIVDQAREIERISKRSVAEITAQKNELRIANERFKMATKASNEMIWDWDLSSGQVQRSVNFRKNFGYSQSKASSMKGFWFSKIQEVDRDRVERSLAQALKNEKRKKWQEEYKLVKASGEIAHLIDRAYILRDKHGKATRMVGSVLDVTAQEEAIRHIKAQNEILKEIAWEQSHVVRAPLARLMGLIQLLESENSDLMAKDEIRKNIIASAEELDSIIRNIVNKSHNVFES